MSLSTFIGGRTAAIALATGLVFTASACDSNEPDPLDPGDQEFITQVDIRLQNDANASDVQTITATSASGIGDDLVFSPAAIQLTPGVTYSGTVTLLDQINDVVVSDEIKDESEEHRFQYTVTPAGAATVVVTDRENDYVSGDANGAGNLPVGLKFQMAVASGVTGSATLNTTLFHFGDGAVKNSATATSDERDIDIDFPVTFAAPVLARAGR